ncbi:MAG: hypothetical protein KAX49_16425 [Halanaerobiales bacterium]|nr:hypothetical protein [Halanaerobiales bacterium]
MVCFFKVYEKKCDDFLQWLISNYDEIVQERAYYDGIKITPETELVQYQACLSFLIISVKVKSKFFVKESHFTLSINVVYSLIALIIGWWGLPWGLIYTIQALANNITGGKRLKLKK